MKICIVLYVISLLMGLMESFPFTVDVANLTINAVTSYTISIFFGNSASRSHISLVFPSLTTFNTITVPQKVDNSGTSIPIYTITDTTIII